MAERVSQIIPLEVGDFVESVTSTHIGIVIKSQGNGIEILFKSKFHDGAFPNVVPRGHLTLTEPPEDVKNKLRAEHTKWILTHGK